MKPRGKRSTAGGGDKAVLALLCACFLFWDRPPDSSLANAALPLAGAAAMACANERADVRRKSCERTSGCSAPRERRADASQVSN